MTYTYKKITEDGPGVIRSDGAALFPGDTAAWREYMQAVFSGYQPLPPDPASTLPRKISKLDIVSRLTDEEAEEVDAKRKQWTAKQRLMWEAAGEMVSTDDELLVSFLDAVLGETRRRQILE